MKPARPRAFTLVELLVVIAIIAILVGLLSVGLSSAIASGKKTKELNRLKQVMLAWSMYSGQYEDQLLPGFLDPAVQQSASPAVSWQVHYKNKKGSDLAPSLCQTYPWRLVPYMDYSYEPILGYRESSIENLDVSLYEEPLLTANLPASLLPITDPLLDGAGAALEPAFGYNAYYIGGWWTQVAGVPVVTFGRDRYTPVGSATPRRGGIVATSLAHLTRPSETLVFTSSTFLNSSADPYSRFTEITAGAAWAVPPRLGLDDVWGFGGVVLEGVDVGSTSPLGELFASMSPFVPAPGVGKLMVYENQGIPLSRYGNTVPVGLADGTVKLSSLDELNDVRLWVPAADSRNFAHGP